MEHWDKMPRYGEGSMLAAALPSGLLNMVKRVHLQHSWFFACACSKISLQCMHNAFLIQPSTCCSPPSAWAWPRELAWPL